MDQHNAAVGRLAAGIQQLHSGGVPFRIFHGSTNSTRPQSFRHDRMVDISGLCHVLKVTTTESAAGTALVEPNVPMDKLVAATLDHGLVPPVVMEFPGITAGGGFAGTAGESSSFRHGLFDRTVNWIEMILANGEVVLASEHERTDLFRAAAGSFGTLGVTTLLEIRLVEAKRYVELTYVPVSSAAEAVAAVRQKVKDPSIEYLDGIMYGKESAVVCAGRLTDGRQPSDSSSSPFSSSYSNDDQEARVQRFSRATDPWFYLHAADVLSSSSASSSSPLATSELVPLTDYLFRYDRGGFWVGALAFRYFLTPFNAFTRWLIAPLTHTRVMYHALHKSGFSHRYIVQDLALPMSTVEQFLAFVDENFSAYPLWLCPVRRGGGGSSSLHPMSSIPDSTSKSTATATSANDDDDDDDMLLNVGLWCPGPATHEAFVEANRAIEHKVYALGGTKWLYAHTYYTNDEFWEIYDRDRYDRLREKYHATALPNLYEKVRTDPEAGRQAWTGLWSVWPLAGIYGVLSAMFGGGYLLPSSAWRRTRRSLALALPFFLGYYYFTSSGDT